MVKEIVAKLEQDGKNEEEIKQELVLIKEEIESYLEPKEDNKEEVVEETEEDMRKRIFGI